MTRAGWTITFEGGTYSESDLTLGAAAKVIETCGGVWAELHPLTSPAHFVSLLAALIELRGGSSFEDELVRLSTLNMVAALDMVSPGEPSANGDVH